MFHKNMKLNSYISNSREVFAVQRGAERAPGAGHVSTQPSQHSAFGALVSPMPQGTGEQTVPEHFGENTWGPSRTCTLDPQRAAVTLQLKQLVTAALREACAGLSWGRRGGKHEFSVPPFPGSKQAGNGNRKEFIKAVWGRRRWEDRATRDAGGWMLCTDPLGLQQAELLPTFPGSTGQH